MAGYETAPRAALRAAIGRFIVGSVRPVHLDGLVAALVDEGLLDHVAADDDTRFGEVFAVVDRDFDLWVSGNDFVVDVDRATAGAVFTHRVSADELINEMLDAAPDLVLLDQTHDVLELPGGRVERIWPEEDPAAARSGSFVGPPGWLDDVAAGDLVALRRSETSLALERVADGATCDGTPEARALRQVFDARVVEPGIGEMIDVVVLDALAEHREIFTAPVPPIGDLLIAAGLARDGDWIGLAGTDFVPPFVADQLVQLAVLVDRYELDDCCLELLERVMEVWNEFVAAPDADGFPERDVTIALSHGWVAAAFADHLLDGEVGADPHVDAFAHRLRDTKHDPAVAVAGFLLARNRERAGDALTAEAHLLEAVHRDPVYEPALEDLAWYIADRGDAQQALNLLRRAGVAQDDPQVQLLESMRPRRNLAGRNERCPCGSGRKYKDCCQRNPTVSLGRRAAWLEHKLWSFTLRPQRQGLPIALAMVMSNDDDDDGDELFELGLPMDVAAFELGLAQDFLEQRGVLLPDDERELLQLWLERPRALYEVVDRSAASGLVLRDTATGERCIVASVVDDLVSPGGALLLARVAPVDGEHRFVGVPIDVPVERRESVEHVVATSPDAWRLARWFADATQPGGDGADEDTSDEDTSDDVGDEVSRG